MSIKTAIVSIIGNFCYIYNVYNCCPLLPMMMGCLSPPSLRLLQYFVHTPLSLLYCSLMNETFVFSMKMYAKRDQKILEDIQKLQGETKDREMK